MPGVLEEAVSKGVQKLVDKSKELESRNKGLEVQIQNSKREIASLLEQVKNLEVRKQGVFKEVMDARKEVVTEMDKQKQELDRLTSLVSIERKAVNEERVKLEQEKDAFIKEAEGLRKENEVLTNRMKRVYSILNEK